MNSNVPRRTIFVAAIAGCAIFFAVVFHFDLPIRNIEARAILTPLVANSISTVTVPQMIIGLPVRLVIPKIHIDVTIDSVGLTSDGAVGVPVGPSTAAWYNLGPRPGEIGSAVIDGHSGWKDNIPAVFDDLHDLTIGDEIDVQDENGVTTAFIVRKISTYGQNAIAPEIFSSTDGVAHLNLITCAGVWNDVTKSSSSRIVIFADME